MTYYAKLEPVGSLSDPTIISGGGKKDKSFDNRVRYIGFDNLFSLHSFVLSLKPEEDPQLSVTYLKLKPLVLPNLLWSKSLKP